MYYIVNTDKSVEQAAADLAKAVQDGKFGVLHIHNIGDTLRSKGFDFKPDVQVFEICSPLYASKVLASDLKLNMALPCRVSVYAEAGGTKIGMVKPALLLGQLSDDPDLKTIAAEVEQLITTIIDSAA